MFRLRFLCVVLALIVAPAAHAGTLKPIRVILVGDSTMTEKAGYGTGFCARFRPEVACLNKARGGRSSKSYRAEGLWDEVITLIRDKGEYDKTYVLIQFGHNDGSHRPERRTHISTEFPLNMRNYALEAQAAGAVPVLVTPLTQRHFKAFRLQNDLLSWAQATRLVARTSGFTLIDLYAEGQARVQEMGIARSLELAGGPIPENVFEAVETGTTVPAVFTDASQKSDNSRQGFDYTHTGPEGSAYFGKMAVDLWVRADPAIAPYVKD